MIEKVIVPEGRSKSYLLGQKFDEIVAFAEIEKFLDTPVKHYSSGIYVRLAFAVAAHLEPEILIVDEALSVATWNSKKSLGKMTQVASGGRTILFVSHNHAAIRSLCTHCIVLRNGYASPKCDVASALENYASDRQQSLCYSWTRPEAFPKSAVHFRPAGSKLARTTGTASQ
jgi:lipopolysaccharide transport system ATP-binding protein